MDGTDIIDPKPGEPCSALDLWEENPQITREQAWEALKHRKLPITPALAELAGSLLAQGLPATVVAEQCGYPKSRGNDLVSAPLVQTEQRKAYLRAGIDLDRLAKKNLELLEAKKIIVAKEKGQITDFMCVDDPGVQHAALQTALDVLTDGATKKGEGSAGARFVVNVNQEFKTIFFPETHETTRNTAITVEPVQPGCDRQGDPGVPETGHRD